MSMERTENNRCISVHGNTHHAIIANQKGNFCVVFKWRIENVRVDSLCGGFTDAMHLHAH